MAHVSVIVIALNQEDNIVPCLETVRWADDIVVVDSGSGDRTLELARGFTDRIFTIDWPGFGAAKNYALDQARGEWVFSLDTDERVSEALRDEVIAVVQGENRCAGYRVPRKNYFGGRWIDAWAGTQITPCACFGETRAVSGRTGGARRGGG